MLRKIRNIIMLLVAMGIAMSGISNAQADLKKIKEQLPKLLGATNQGTEFVIAFHPAWEEYGPNNRIKLYISSGVATDVRITIPYYSNEPRFILRTKPNDIIVQDLLPSEAQPYTRGGGGYVNTLKPTQVWPGRGIIIEADAPIIVYGVTRYQYTSDGFLAIPTHALGKQYIVSSYRETCDLTLQSLTPYVSIVGVYDKTNVQFYLGGNNGSIIIDADHNNKVYQTGQSLRATLNRGDDWLIATQSAYSDLGGSYIYANKPVAVISGTHCAYIPTDKAACDFIIEQEYPMNAWGRKYHVTAIAGRKRSSIVRLFAKEANTRFYKDYNVDDTTQAFFVNAAAWGIKDVAWLETRAAYDSNTGMVVTANKPIMVVQYNPGIEDDQVDSDPFQMMLIPEEQFLNDIIFNTPGIRGGFGFDVNYINIVYKSDLTGQIPDDLLLGDVSPTTGETNFKKLKDWSSAPGDRLYDPDYRNSPIKIFSKIVKLPYDAVWRIVSPTQKIMAYSYGFSWCDSYGEVTAAAIADLERPDIVVPIPYYELLCDGTTDTTRGKYPYVTDMPDDDSIRSNMSLITFDRNNSVNYDFAIAPQSKGWVPGEARTVFWKAWTLDPSQDGEAIITFADRAGNDTTIQIIYTAVKLSMTPRTFYFGNMKTGEKKTQTFTVRNDSKRKVALQELSLQTVREKLADQGFTLNIPFDLSDSLDVGESRTFEVTFTAPREGEFRDSIGVGDDCFYQYKAIVRASVGTPIINVSDVDFGEKTVGEEWGPMIATIKNNGSTSLAITGYTGPTLGVYRTDLEDMNISADNPLIVGINQTVQFRIWFKPDAEQSYPDSIVFISDAGRVNDPVCMIQGVGIKAQLEATGENWGEKRAHLAKYDTYTYQTFGYPYPSPTGAIVLRNPGTKDVSILQINVLDSLQADAFEIDVDGVKQPLVRYLTQLGSIKDDQGRTITTIEAGGTRHVPVYFNPRAEGAHKLVIEYVSDAGMKPTSTLEGIGIYPLIGTQNVDYGTNVVGDKPVVRTVRFGNVRWDYQDSLILQGFTVEPDGSISPVIGTPGSEGFSYDGANIIDKTGNAITLPYTLQPGEYVEVTGQFAAQRPGNALANLTSISDALVDARSQWRGYGVAESLQLLPGAEPYICYNTEQEIVVTLQNNGTDTVRIPANSISIINDSKGYFKIVRVINAANVEINTEADYYFVPDDRLSIVVGYNPVNWSKTNNVEEATADVQVRTDAVTPSFRVMTVPIKGSAIHYVRTTYSEINGKTQVIVEPGQSAGAGYKGDPITYSIYIKDDKELDLTGPTQLTIKINYVKNFLAIKESGNNLQVSVGADMTGWNIDKITRKLDKTTNEEEVTVVMSGLKPFQSSAKSELLRVEFLAFLPYYTNVDEMTKEKETKISHEVVGNEQCVEFTDPVGSSAVLSEVCMNNLRPILLSSTDYSMGKVNPEPLSAEGGTLDFGIGLTGETHIRIVNSAGEVVAVLADGVMKVGNYSVRIPVEKLVSGVYFIEMQSGEFKEVQKIVVKK